MADKRRWLLLYLGVRWGGGCTHVRSANLTFGFAICTTIWCKGCMTMKYHATNVRWCWAFVYILDTPYSWNRSFCNMCQTTSQALRYGCETPRHLGPMSAARASECTAAWWTVSIYVWYSSDVSKVPGAYSAASVTQTAVLAYHNILIMNGAHLTKQLSTSMIKCYCTTAEQSPNVSYSTLTTTSCAVSSQHCIWILLFVMRCTTHFAIYITWVVQKLRDSVKHVMCVITTELH